MSRPPSRSDFRNASIFHLMKNDRTVNDISDLGADRYPHLKITNETVPRVLATRRIEDDDAEYFGAFLTKTAVRILIDFLNRVFKLRTCDIEIDGSFPVPCTQFYRKRCLAPCVEKLCSRDEYLHTLELAKLFLSDQRRLLTKALRDLINRHSENLDFETAARYRDILQAVEKFWKQPRWSVWLDDAVDTYAVEDTADGVTIYLVTHRGRGVLGRKVFTVTREDFESPDEALAKIIESFYVFHLPKEIRVSRNFHGRTELAERLAKRFGRAAKISVVNPKTKGVNAYRGLILGRAEHELDSVKPLASADVISARLAKIFELARHPTRVEAFDVAHISGTGFVAASAVWDFGRFLSAEYQFLLSEEKSELAALADAVVRRLIDKKRKPPDLVVLDGGKSQLNKVLKSLDGDVRPAIIAAVKPRGKHSAIAAFLTPAGESVPFDAESPAHNMLQLLRDEAHDLANRIHRDYREMLPFYEAAGHATPLIVPLRFHAENGGADDLIPIETR